MKRYRVDLIVKNALFLLIFSLAISGGPVMAFTEGSFNNFFGTGAGDVTTAGYNSFFGGYAGVLNTTG